MQQTSNKFASFSTKLENVETVGTEPTFHLRKAKKNSHFFEAAAILIFFVHAPRSHAEEVPQRRDVAVTGRPVDAAIASGCGAEPRCKKLPGASNSPKKKGVLGFWSVLGVLLIFCGRFAVVFAGVC